MSHQNLNSIDFKKNKFSQNNINYCKIYKKYKIKLFNLTKILVLLTKYCVYYCVCTTYIIAVFIHM